MLSHPGTLMTCDYDGINVWDAGLRHAVEHLRKGAVVLSLGKVRKRGMTLVYVLTPSQRIGIVYAPHMAEVRD